MIARLSILMFLQYAVMGAWVPLFSLHLKERGFTPGETAWCFATSAIGALLAPLPWGQIADRWLAAQKCITLCGAAASLCLFVLAELVQPWAVFLVSLVYWFFMYPVVGLGTALTFRHLTEPAKQFGKVRLWGTVGWMAAGWLLGLWYQAPYLTARAAESLAWLEPLAEWFAEHPPAREDMLRLAALISLLLALYAFTLPHTPPNPARPGTSGLQGLSRLKRLFEAPLLAARLLRRRSLGVLCGCMFGMYITVPFFSQLLPLLLDQLGVSDQWLPVTLTLSQSLEVVTLGMLPVILLRLEEKGTLFAGMLAWAVGFGIMASGAPLWLVGASLGLNGIFICCFLVTAQMFVQRKAPADIRASAQGLLQFINGIGMLIGHLLVGWLRDLFEDRYALVFLFPTIVAAAMTLIFLPAFRDKPEASIK